MPEKNSEEENLEKESDEKEDLDEESEDENEDGESELEEELKEGFDEFQFNQISWSTPESGTKAPVLEAIAEEQPAPVFVGTIPQRPVGTLGENEDDEFKYVPGSEEGEESKYITTPSGVNNQPNRIDLSKAGREPLNSLNQSPTPHAESYTPKVESPMPEKAWTPKRMNLEKAGKDDIENPNERDEIKYEKYKSRPSNQL